MPPAPPTVERPQRWDAAFDPAMTEADVARLLAIPPFNKMLPAYFPKRTPLREILRHDTSIRHYRKGEIITRQGDYGTSAFLILSGTTRVVLKPDLPPALLGRQAPVKKGFFRTLAQFWSGRRPPESYNRAQLRPTAGVGARRKLSGGRFEDQSWASVRKIPFLPGFCRPSSDSGKSGLSTTRVAPDRIRNAEVP